MVCLDALVFRYEGDRFVYFSCFVLRTVDISDASWGFQLLCGDVEMFHRPRMDETFGGTAV